MRQPGLLKPPRQERSREPLRRILDAARALLGQRDFEEISVDDIVERAGSSKGSFYQRFSDKDSLLVYLLREEHEAATKAWSKLLDPDRWRNASLGAVLDAFLDHLMEIYRGHATLMRAYAGKVFGGEREIRTLSVQLSRHVLELLRRIVREKAEEAGHPDPERAAAFLLTALITLLPPLVLSSHEFFPEPMSPDLLEREVRLLIRSYLGVDREG